MCQSKADGGKRCPLHMLGSRALLDLARVQHGLDRDQSDAVFRKARDKARPARQDPTGEAWEAFLDDQIEAVALDLTVDSSDFDRIARRLHAAKREVPDAQTFAALKAVGERARKAASALRRQTEAAAALRGVDPEAVAERVTAYRAQYRRQLAHLPADERPAPPPEWVDGFTRKDLMAVSAPADPATLYAFYRCQADPDAFPDATGSRFASIDLETAGPAGRDGFNPENGSIIEVGIIEYDRDGVETDRYSQLVAPDPDVAARCGTGAVDVHGITMEDLTGAPGWDTVAPQVAARLRGRTMMAQNARFERDWLAHHMARHGQDFDRWGPTVDTMCVAQQHLPRLENHRLATICAEVGVAYTDGHRATHDAEVAAQAFFALQQRITRTYRACPVRTAVPQPPVGYGARARNNRVIRLSENDFIPSQVVDPWTVHAAAAPVSV